MPPYTASTSFFEATPPRPTAASITGLPLSTPPRGRALHGGIASSDEASPFSSGHLPALTFDTPPFPLAPPLSRTTGSNASATNAAADFCWARSTPCQDSLWHDSHASAAPWGGSHRDAPDVNVETPDKLKWKSQAVPVDIEEVKGQLNPSVALQKQEVPSCTGRQEMAESSSAMLRAEAAEFVPWAGMPGFHEMTMADVHAAVTSELVAVENQKAAFPSIPPPLPESLTAAVSHMAEIDDSSVVLPAYAPATMPSTVAKRFQPPTLPTGMVETLPWAPEDGAIAAAIDSIFEPFALQHNSHLLLVIARQLAAGAQGEGWPWTSQALRRVLFSTEDIVQCTRKLPQTEHSAALLHVAAHPNPELLKSRYLCLIEGAWRLRSPPEIRCFLSAPNATRSLVAATTRAILGRSSPPPGVVTVLSYSVTKLFQDKASDEEEKQKRLMQQLRACHTDILCLQGFQPQTDAGKALAMSLKADGFAYAAAAPPQGVASGSQANAIFWDQRRWEAACEPRGHGHVGCAALLVELRLREEPATIVRVASLQPQLVDCCDPELGLALNAAQSAASTWAPMPGLKKTAPPPKQQIPLLVCTDLSDLGGAESAALVPGLLHLRSAMVEATGEELASPVHSAPALDKDAQQSLRLRPLCRHDAVLFRNMTRVLVLSGHTEGYLSTMPDNEFHKQLPAGRLPIVAAFSLAE